MAMTIAIVWTHICGSDGAMELERWDGMFGVGAG